MSRDDRDDRRGGRDRDDRGGRDDRGSRDRDDRGSRTTSSRDDRGSRDRDDRGSRDRDDRGGRDDRGSGSSAGYTYRQRSADEVKQRSNMGAREYDKMLKPGVKMWSPGDQNRARLLPPTWDGAKHYGLDVYVHYGVGPDRESYICPLKHADSPCPICEEREEARRENNPDEDYVKELEPKRRVLAWLVDRENDREGVQAWMMPWTVDKDITKVSVDKENGEVLPIDHPEDGYDVMFDKSGKGRNTKYEGVSIARRSSPLGKAAWLDYAMDNPLPDQLVVFPYDQIAKTFGAKGVQRDDRGGSARDDDRGRDSKDRDDRGGRDREERGGRDDRGDGRDDRRDDRRGGGRDEPRDERGAGRDRDDDRRGGGRERERSRDDEPTWESVHAMTRTELEDLVELKALPIKPREAKDDDDLADWVCEEMKLEKAPASRERRSSTADAPARDEGDKLRDLRNRRND